jgi:hypothetical protein
VIFLLNIVISIPKHVKIHPNIIHVPILHPKLCNVNLHNVTHSLISRNPRERLSVVRISLLIVTSLSLMSRNLSLMQTTQEVNPHPCIASYVNMWVPSSSSATCWMLVHAYAASPGKAKWSGPHHTIKMSHFVLFHSVTCYTNHH